MKKSVLTAVIAAALLLFFVASAQADEGWRIISVPCYTGESGVADVFELPPLYVFEIAEDGGYAPLNGSIIPGKSYWMYFEDTPRPGAGCMTISYSTIDLTIEPGWNLIGNPFISTMELPENLQLAYSYSPETGQYEKVTKLEPWTGYFIHSDDICRDGCSLLMPNPVYIGAGRADEPRLPRVVSCPVSGDTDGNSLVDASDLFAISQYYGTVISASTSSTIRMADTDGNGIVDASDMFAISRNYGDSCTGGITNRPPVATSQSVSTSQDLAVDITLSGTDADGDTLTYAIVSSPADGTLDITSLPVVTYTPDSGFYGVDSFTFNVSDGQYNSVSAAVAITVAQSDTPSVASVTNVTVAPDPLRRYSSLKVSWDPPDDTSINAYDIYCNGELVNACPERLQCYDGMDCDPDIVYTYFINIPNLTNPPPDPANYQCSAQIQAYVIDSSDLIAAQSQLSAAVAASTFAHTADSPYAGGTTTKEGTAPDCSSIRSGGRTANAGAGTVPLANAKIEAWRKESSSESPNGTLVATVYANAQGYYEFSSLDPGYYNFIALHDNDTSQTDDDIYSILESINIQPDPFASGGFNDLGEMKLEETGSMYGTVRLALDSTGDSLLAVPDDSYLGIDVYIPGTSFTAKTNRSGEFYILYLPPGTYSIVATADDYALVQRDDITIESKQITTVTPDLVLLASIGSVVGVATFADSSNNGDASVTIVNESDSMTTYNTSTLTDGSFTFSGVATGTYTVNIIRYGWDPYELTGVHVLSNTTTDIGTIGPIARIPAPNMTGITPASGDNDAATTITITGTNFATGTLFYIKKGITEAELDNITFVSETQMTADVPSGYDWGTYDIKAVNPDAQTDTLTGVFSVTLPAPTVSAVSPNEMDNSYAIQATVTGTGFVSGCQVKIGTTVTSNTTVNQAGTSLTTTVPAGVSPGIYDVTVTNPDSAGLSATLSASFTSKALSLITPDPATLSIMSGDTRQFSATCSYTDSATTTQTICTSDVLWYTSNTSVGTITLNGGLFTAVNYGQTYVSAQRGSITSSAVLATVYSPETIFLDSGDTLDTGSDDQAWSILADLNDDGYPDLLTDNWGSQRIYSNDGSGTLTYIGSSLCTSMSHDVLPFGVADLDGDNDLDVACDGFVSGYGDRNVFYENYDGTATDWRVGTAYSYTDPVSSITVADFNQDGRPDWAAAGDGYVDIILNEGNQSFSWTGIDYGSDSNWFAVAGDIDGDQDNDLIAAIYGGANRLWLNDGDGTGAITDGGTMAGSYKTTALVLVDLDADGDLDIFEGTGGYETTDSQPDKIWVNNGSGSFTDSGQSFSASLTTSAAAIDFDNDGDSDLIAGIGQGGFDIFYLNDGNGTLTSSGQSLSTTYTNTVAVGDINGDYKADFIAGTLSGTKIFTGGHGGIQANNKPTAPTILSEEVKDLDGDSQYNDVTLTWNDGSDAETQDILLTYNLSIRRSDGVYLMAEVNPVGPGNVGQTTTITMRNLPIGTYSWKIQTVDTGFRTSDWSVDRTFTTGMTITGSGNELGAEDTGAIAVADFDGDGNVDIVEGRNSTGGGANVVWAGDGAGAYSTLSSFGSYDTTSMFAADIDGDGDADLVEGTSGTNYLWLNNGSGSFSDSGESVGSASTSDVAVADFDLDGDLDVFIANSGSSSSIYRNTGSGSFEIFAEVATWTETGGADTSDTNNDGYVDIILAARADGVKVYSNDGTGIMSLYTQMITFKDAVDVVYVDLIGSDFLEDVAIALENYYVAHYRNNKTYFIDPYISPDKMNTVKVLGADMDVDGDLDVVALNYGQPAQVMLHQTLFEYDGIDRTNLPSVPASDGVIADVDGDGDLDVVVAAADGYNTSYDTFLLNSQVKANTNPGDPSGLSASGSGNDVVLQWSDGSDTETSSEFLTYDVRIVPAAGGDWLRPAVAGPGFGVVTATNTLVLHNAPADDYTWYVRTIDAGMQTSAWVQGSNFRAEADTTAPVFGAIVSADNLELSQTVKLTWSAATDGSSPVKYNIYQATVSGGQNYSSPDYATYGLSYTVTGLTDYQQYCFVVRAEDSANPPNEDTNTTELCATPTPDETAPTFTGLDSASSGTNPGTVELTWTAGSDTNEPVVYNVYYSTTSGGQNFSSPSATTTTGTGMTASGLTSGQLYYFVVRARDSSQWQNEDTNSVELSATATLIPDVLILDADGGSSYETYYETALANLGITYANHDKSVSGAISSDTLTTYLGAGQMVIWFTGTNYSYSSIMNATEQGYVIDFLDSGGKMFVSGMDFGYAMKSTTVYSYLGASGDLSDGGSEKTSLIAISSDPISDGLTVDLFTGDGAAYTNYNSNMNTTGTGTECFYYSDGVKIACVKNDTGTYRTVFFGFGFEEIDDSADGDRDTIMQNVYNWLTQ